MKPFKPLLATLFLVATTGVAYAQEFGGDDINGYLGFGYGIESHSSNYVTGGPTGSRSRFDLEFGRLSSNVAMSFGYGTGLGYSSIGGHFKAVRPIQLPQASGPFLIVPGISFGANYSGSGTYRVLTDTGKTKFCDFTLGPAVALVYDFKVGLAVALDMRYDFVIARRWSSAPHRQTSPADKIMFFGLSLMVDSRFIE